MSKVKPGPSPSRTAKVIELAVEAATINERDSNIEERILDRIKKCLQRANHRNTPEAEAQAAWRMASRLMAQYNVTQADLLDQTTEDGDYAALGGQSVVAIRSTQESGSRVISQTWVHDVARAMTLFFDCQTYTAQSLASIEWTFMGLLRTRWPRQWHSKWPII